MLGMDENEPQDKTISWLQEKWGDENHCPMCGATSWVVSSIGGLSEWVPKQGFRPDNAYPVVPVHCGNCAFVALINAVAAGIVEPDESDAVDR